MSRTARWGEPLVNDVCQWCYEQTASIRTRWYVDEYTRASSFEYRLRDVDGRSCLICKEYLHRDIAIEGPRAT